MPKSLLFIPDITGFTEFVNNTEIEHGQHIISELLEKIIDSNELSMEISEVEGDAVLFYSQTPDGQLDPKSLHGAGKFYIYCNENYFSILFEYSSDLISLNSNCVLHVCRI